MAQTTQIVPKYNHPNIETVVNDYTLVPNDNIDDGVDNSVRQIYAVAAPKGIDNTWVYKKTASSATKTFGDPNFKKYGQPFMQAIHVLDQDNASCYIMRVMPENATFANGLVFAGWKADTEDDYEDAHLRKFRMKLHSEVIENVTSDAVLKAAFNTKRSADEDGFTQINLLNLRTSGRGTYGQTYSVRVSQPIAYEKQFGIKMYDFEALTSEAGLYKDADCVGGLVSSGKYINRISTYINDVMYDATVGDSPIDVYTDEDNVEVIYDAYIEFAKTLHDDCVAEYEEKLVEYAIPDDMMSGAVPVSDEYLDEYNELMEIDAIIDATEEDKLPELDQFDPIYGRRVGSMEMLPGIMFIKKLTDDVDTEAEDYDPNDYTEDDDLVDFSSTTGLPLAGGTNGYFDNPRTTTDTDGKVTVWTYEDELELCYNNAFNGTYDSRILSKKRMPLTVFFDANYPFSVKSTIADVVLARRYCRFFMDANILESLSYAECAKLANKYAAFDDYLLSLDIHNYMDVERGTYKKINVTITYFMAAEYVNHYTNNGFHIPFVKANCRLSGHAKNSLKPFIDDYETDIKEYLYENRINYFECYEENVFQRGVQNTRQSAETDLLEENDAQILCELKKSIEKDLDGQIYNFADNATRSDFVRVEEAKYADWNNRVVESIAFSFKVSQYEFTHSILHLYIEVVFRGLTKRAIVEIDLNQRDYSSVVTEEEE